MSITAVIFDCDGVLVDSEMLSAGVLQDMMAEIGMPMSDEIFRDVFLGRSFANATARAEIVLGIELPSSFESQYRDRLFAVLSESLGPMAGVVEVLSSMRVPFCLATSSTPRRLALSLKVTGLGQFFEDNKFTASEVLHGKPAPDLCFPAAQKMNMAPKNCLVIEDSEMGIQAANAAGMEVWYFAGGAHVKAGYRLPETLSVAKVIPDMPSLLDAFVEIGVSKRVV